MRTWIAASLGLVVLSACTTSGSSEPALGDDESIRSAIEDAARANTPLKRLRTQLALALEYRAQSNRPGLSDEAYFESRENLGTAAGFAADVCADGAPDSRAGGQCALAIALSFTNDAIVAGRNFDGAVASANWTDAKAATDSLAISADRTWERYDASTRVLGTVSEQSVSQWRDMRLRSTCSFVSAPGIGTLIRETPAGQTEPSSEERERLEAQTSYRVAMAAAARQIGVPSQNNVCANPEDNRAMCHWALERALGETCSALASASQ